MCSIFAVYQANKKTNDIKEVKFKFLYENYKQIYSETPEIH